MIIGIINAMTKSKQVLITGTSSGFGFRLALLYARNGYTTYASVRNLKSDGAIELIHSAKKEALPLHVVHIDVTDDTTIAHTVNSIQGSIDILINNAGFGMVGPVEDFTVDEIKKQYDTNVFGTIRMIKAVAPRLNRLPRLSVLNFLILA